MAAARLVEIASGSRTSTSSCGRATGSGRSTSAFSSWNIAVLAPMPRASETTATRVKTGVRAQRADGVAEIAADDVERARGRGRRGWLPWSRRAPPKREPGPPPRLARGSTPARSSIAGVLFEVEAQLVVQLALDGGRGGRARAGDIADRPACGPPRRRSATTSSTWPTASVSRRQALVWLSSSVAALARQRVELGAAVVVGGAPLGLDPAAPLEAVQRRIERALLHAQGVARDQLDALRDRPAVLRLDRPASSGSADRACPAASPACVTHRLAPCVLRQEAYALLLSKRKGRATLGDRTGQRRPSVRRTCTQTAREGPR